MSKQHTLLASMLLASSALAQSYFSAPPGYLTTEGPSSTTAFTPFYDVTSRAQWLYGGLRGNAYPAINRFEQRRDGVTATGTYPARTIDLLVIMSDTNLAAGSTTFASNYVGSPTTVYTKKPTNFPDHSTNVGSPAPWSVSVPFDSNFTYTGLNDLLLEVQVDNAAGNVSYSIDCVSAGAGGGAGTFSYNGLQNCTTPNGVFDIFGRNPATNGSQVCTFSTYALRGPSSAPAVLAIGLSDPNIAGIFCAPIRTSVDLTLPFTTDAVGGLGSSATPISFTFPVGYPSITLYTQFAAIDPSQSPQPLALSDAVKSTVVQFSPPTAAYYYDYNSSSATTGTSYPSYIAVTRFTY